MVDLQPYEGAGRLLSKRVLAALSVGATLLLAPAAYYYSSTSPQSAALDMATEEYTIGADPKMQDCSSMVDNCMSNKCCQTSGMKCWRISGQYFRKDKATHYINTPLFF